MGESIIHLWSGRWPLYMSRYGRWVERIDSTGWCGERDIRWFPIGRWAGEKSVSYSSFISRSSA